MAAVAHPSRPQLRRNSPITSFSASYGLSAHPGMVQRINVGDDSDSDDEPPPAIKFSKVTQALLADVAPVSPARQEQSQDALRHKRSISVGQAGLDTPSRVSGLRIIRRNSPSSMLNGNDQGHGPISPRVVNLNMRETSPPAKTSVRLNAQRQHAVQIKRDPTPEASAKPEMITPGPATRAVRTTRIRTGSNASQDERPNLVSSASRPSSRNASRPGPDTSEKKNYVIDLGRSASLHHSSETISRFGGSVVGRSRNAQADSTAHASQGIKRLPEGENKFLRSKPVRRGFRRRDSDENVSPLDDPQSGQSSHPSVGSFTPQERSQVATYRVRSRSNSVQGRATSVEPVASHDFANDPPAAAISRPASRQGISNHSRNQPGSDSRPPSRQTSREVGRHRQTSAERIQRQPQDSVDQGAFAVAGQYELGPRQTSIDQDRPRPPVDDKPPSRVSSLNRATYRYVPPVSRREPADDQENLPPPTFKRNKDQEFKYLGKPSLMAFADEDKPKQRNVEETPVLVSQQESRRPLGAISGNTPHRAAPAPPPKMTVLDAATTTAGASTTKSRKKRQHMVVNGKIYTQMGKLGKGGSSDVYCVMAENYKTFALKRVKLDNCDESAVRGYKGEIDLLKKLTEVERVVRLFDWELNEEKQELVLLMDKGELDLSRILTLQLNGHDARFDTVFTRFYWKEMLECVQAVHDHDIVHSDLKPANFLMVQGRLKLIDFGIANAIDTDNTCNVHRDSHVGTPNYMSPESINDTNASGTGKDDAGRPLKKDMRIGKSSDVWSLGCILYQMTYGTPPFAHIKSQVSRIMAIVNPKHSIEYPETGIGGAIVPLALRKTLRGCLNRDAEQRPTIEQMLNGTDAFLNPEEHAAGGVLVSEELLGQIINKIIERCRDPVRGIPSPSEAQQYPKSFIEKIRQMQEGR